MIQAYYGSAKSQNAKEERSLLKLGGANIYVQLLKAWETFMDACRECVWFQKKSMLINVDTKTCVCVNFSCIADLLTIKVLITSAADNI